MADQLKSNIKRSLTDDELEILKEEDENLEKRAFEFCFDNEIFNERLQKGDRWQQLIQCHIYLDHIITQQLNDVFKYPDAIKLPRVRTQLF